MLAIAQLVHSLHAQTEPAPDTQPWNIDQYQVIDSIPIPAPQKSKYLENVLREDAHPFCVMVVNGVPRLYFTVLNPVVKGAVYQRPYAAAPAFNAGVCVTRSGVPAKSDVSARPMLYAGSFVYANQDYHVYYDRGNF